MSVQFYGTAIFPRLFDLKGDLEGVEGGGSYDGALLMLRNERGFPPERLKAGRLVLERGRVCCKISI